MPNLICEAAEHAVKTLTVANPAAWLIAAGHKTWIVRDRATRYRGTLAIAATKPTRAAMIAPNWRVAELLTAAGYRSIAQLPAQAIVATVNVVECEPIPHRHANPDWYTRLPADETTLEEFTPGRYAWQLDLLARHDPPLKWDPPPPQPAAMPAKDTSVAALGSIEAESNRLRAWLFDEIAKQGTHGATCEELEQSTGLRRSTCSARLSELKRSGAVIDSGRRRQTSAGRAAAVLVVPPAPQAKQRMLSL